MNVQTTINNDIENVFVMGSVEANAMQNGIRKKISELQEPIRGAKYKVVLYWFQARKDLKSQTGNRAIIESIIEAPVKVIVDEHIKNDMLLGVDNPFKMAYVVDVEVETVRGKTYFI